MSGSCGDPSYDFGEVPVVASVHSAQRATPDELVRLAQTISRRVKEAGLPAGDTPENDALLERLQAEFADFSQSFPLVLRWMVHMRQFHPEAFRKYLLRHSSTKLDSREAFLRLQAEYLVLLYRETHRRPDENYLRQYRESVVAQLLAEDKAFFELQKQVEAEMEARAREIDGERRERLCQYLLAQQVARERDEARGAASRGGDPPPPTGGA